MENNWRVHAQSRGKKIDDIELQQLEKYQF